MSEIKKVVKDKKGFPLLPVVIFIGVVAMTVGLFAYTNMLQTWIDDTRTAIIKHEAEINKLKEDASIQIAQLLTNNKETIAILEDRSHISKYIDHLDEIGGALIKFTWFDLQDGNVTTKAEVKALKGKQAYKNVEKFIEKYRGSESQDELFDLNFVNSFEGNDTISFTADFTLKDPVIEEEVTQEEASLDDASDSSVENENKEPAEKAREVE